ncbi:MAG TPA: hypothetical protein VKF28_02240 [Candidatus Dormibacteraeota bacterium]|nr:hypothetical protein [Candidatus Dormibacteraeota bacterium]
MTVARLWSLVDKRALLVTAVCLVVWRLLEQIPVSDVTQAFITTRLYNLSNGPGFFLAIGPNSLPFASLSLAAEGIGPYIDAWILMNIAVAVSVRLGDLLGQPAGRKTVLRWTRFIALVLALGQAYGFTVLYQFSSPPAFGALDWSARLAVCLALTGGTAMMILLADALDDFGLGFGYGAVILYALASLGSEVHRIAAYFASAPSVEALYKPMAVWTAFTLGTTVAGVAVLLAVRRIEGTELRVLMSGVLRPPEVAVAVVILPTLMANSYYASFPNLAQWISESWQPYGPKPWLDVGYVLLHGGLVVLFAVFFVFVDGRVAPFPPHLRAHVTRLAVIGGLFLAFAVIAVPVANHFLTRAAGQSISISGADVLLVVAVILVAVRSIEGYRPVVPFTASPSGLP